MGFFSWRTCDTLETIPSLSAQHIDMRPVYLLQPDGREPIVEEFYSGYGNFGGINAYNWLAFMNGYGTLEDMKNDCSKQTNMGITISFGCKKDKDTGELFSSSGFPGATRHGFFDRNVNGYDRSSDQLIKDGQIGRAHV